MKTIIAFVFAALIIYHWVGTFLNTPRPPGRKRRADQ